LFFFIPTTLDSQQGVKPTTYGKSPTRVANVIKLSDLRARYGVSGP